MSVAIRLLGPGDARVLDRVAPEVFDEPVRADRAAEVLAEPGHLLLVALDGDLVVGQCAAVVHRHPDKATELYIGEVGVSPAWQRQGIGRGLVTGMLEIGRDRGCAAAWLGTEHDNAAARGLYEGLGAKPPDPFILYLFPIAAERPQGTHEH